MVSRAGSFRFGIIGCGCIGREHINNIALLDSATVVAVADSFEGSRKACCDLLHQLGMMETRILEDYRELLQMQDLDGVIVATPNHHHIHVIRDAFATPGIKGLMVEKPLCTTMEDCFEVLQLVAQHPEVVFWVGMEYRYIPSIDRLITQVHSGAIGTPKMLSIREHRFPFLQKVGNWNRFTSNTGGTLVEKCCHFFDLMLHIMEAKPLRIMASGAQDVNHIDEVYDGRQSDILDNAYVVIEFEGGGRACMDICMFAEASRHQEEIACVGTTGKIEAFAPAHGAETDDERLPNFIIGTAPFGEKRKISDEPPPPIRPQEMHVAIDERLMKAGHHCGATYYELEVFVSAVRQQQKAHVDAIDGMLAVALGLAAHKAIDEMRIVSFSEMGVDDWWGRRHGALTASADVNENAHKKASLALGKTGSSQKLLEMQKDLPMDGEKQTQVDGWELSMRGQRQPSK